MIPYEKQKQMKSWWFWIAGFFACCWLLLRSGTNPKRITYPCQQAAFPLATAWLLALVALWSGNLVLRKWFKGFAPVILVLGIIWILVSFPGLPQAKEAILEDPPIWQVDNPMSKVFVLDAIPPTSGSLQAGDATVPDAHLSDPAIDTLLAIMTARDIHFYRHDAQPTGIVGADNVVIIKGNYQWSFRNTTNTDRIKGLIWRILQHPGGFTGEIIVCDNTQDIGTGINHEDNNSDYPAQSIVHVVNTFYAKGYPVYLLDWNYIWDTVVDEYSDGNNSDGYVYETDTKISYPKFRSPSGEHYISLRYGIWDRTAAEYNSTRLCIINFPVLKAHWLAGATIAVKNWVGVMTTAYADDRYGSLDALHSGYLWSGWALAARVMAVTYPRLSIVDATWTDILHQSAWDFVNTDILLASTDPIAVSWYAAKYILTPIARDPTNTDPDDVESEYCLALGNWAQRLQRAGKSCTKNPSKISVYDRRALAVQSIEEPTNPPTVDGFQLQQNYPNPFNPVTTIRYELPHAVEVTLNIYNLRGREVAKLVEDYMEPGYHQTQWDGWDISGRQVPSGIYIARLVIPPTAGRKAPEYTQSIKMVLLR